MGYGLKKKLIAITMITEAFLLLFSGCGKIETKLSVREVSAKYSVADENQLIVYTSHKKEVYLPIIQEFENRTGIYVDIKAGGTQEMMEMASEASEKSGCDIMFGGGVESFEAWKDIFMPYQSGESEKLDQKFLSTDGTWTPFTELPIVFIYNRKLMNSSSAPRSWEQLFDEKWKGRIAFADMDNSGTSYTIVSTISQMTGESPDAVVEKLFNQLNGKVLKSSGDVIPDVSNGTTLIGITLEETALKAINKGYNIEMIYPQDGTSAVPDGCAIVKNAPHQENAKLFIDFITGYDTQCYAMEEFSRRPVREDVALKKDFGDFTIIDFDVEKSAADENIAFGAWHRLTGQED